MGRFQNLAVIIIPAYNEEKSIGEVVAQLVSIASVLVVNDCSTDNTSQVAEKAGAKVLSLDSNVRYEGALRAGFLKANELGFQYFITCDADGQHRSQDVEKVVTLLIEEGLDLVIGERQKKSRLAEKIFGIYTKLKFSVDDPLSGLKGYSKNAFDLQRVFSTYDSVGTQLALNIMKSKLNYKTTPIVVADRLHGKPRFGSLIQANGKILKSLFLWIIYKS